MESVIKWQTGEPKEEGCYLVTYQILHEKCIEKFIEVTEYEEYGWSNTSASCKVVAWCPLSEIEPYKE